MGVLYSDFRVLTTTILFKIGNVSDLNNNKTTYQTTLLLTGNITERPSIKHWGCDLLSLCFLRPAITLAVPSAALVDRSYDS